MKYAILFAAFLLSIYTKAQVQVFALEHNSGTSMFDNLDSAIKHAQNGDVIYLPGGSIALNSQIRKSIALIGAGYHYDSTAATSPSILSDDLLLKTGANNILLTGIIFKGGAELDSCTNIIFDRCKIESRFYIRNCTTTVFKQCVVLDLISDNTSTSNQKSRNTSFQNCIIYWPPTDITGVTIDNGIVFNAQKNSSSYLLLQVSQLVARNNIFSFKRPSPTNLIDTWSGSSYYNNIFTDSVDYSSASVFSNNKVYIPLQTVFVNMADSLQYSSLNNLHLKPGSPAIGFGTSGTDCGIYGGTEPFKEGGVPMNPHIQSAQISSMTDQKGNLKINIKVRAQNK